MDRDDREKEAGDVRNVRLACRQFAMLYFHFCETMFEALGEEKALALVQKAVFELGLDRSEGSRDRAAARGLAAALENFAQVNDLPEIGWSGWKPEMGGCRCPYAETWLSYFQAHPWFKRFASLYCDVIDTTNIENFTRSLSHRITRNLLWGDPSCEREFFESPKVKAGRYTYADDLIKADCGIEG